MKLVTKASLVAFFAAALPAALTLDAIDGSGASMPGATLHAAENTQEQGHQGGLCGRPLRGRWGYAVSGTQFFPPPAPPVQATAVGMVELDAHGGLTGSDIASFGGQVFARTLTGTYTVQPGCTLDVTVQILSGTPGLVLTFTAVMVDNGRKMLVIQKDPGALFAGTLER